MDAKSEETAQVYELLYLIACEAFEYVVFWDSLLAPGDQSNSQSKNVTA